MNVFGDDAKVDWVRFGVVRGSACSTDCVGGRLETRR